MKAMISIMMCSSLMLASSLVFADEPTPTPGDLEAPASSEPSSMPPPAPVATPARTAGAAAERTEPVGPVRNDLIRLNAGLRLGYVPSRGFDTFASNDVLTQFSIDGTYPFITSGKLVLAAGLGWDVGGRSDEVRGFSASLMAHRLYAPVEARYRAAPWLNVFGKVAPGAAALVTSIKAAAPGQSELATTGWAFSADASVGASILVGPRSRMDRRGARFWITPEIGYAFTTNAPLRANVGRKEEDVLGSDADTSLRSLALSGLFWRASVGTTF